MYRVSSFALRRHTLRLWLQGVNAGLTELGGRQRRDEAQGKQREEGGKNEGGESGKGPVSDHFPLRLPSAFPSLFPGSLNLPCNAKSTRRQSMWSIGKERVQAGAAAAISSMIAPAFRLSSPGRIVREREGRALSAADIGPGRLIPGRAGPYLTIVQEAGRQATLAGF